MVTQAIKRWLDNLFAWWPWKRSPKSGYAHPVTPRNTGAAQESKLRTTVDGSVSQPGTTSIAVERAQDTIPPEQHRPIPPKPEERFVSPPASEEKPALPATSPIDAEKQPKPKPKPTAAGEDIPAPTPEQQLEFLRYLVQRGLVNEGFEYGKEPEQYKKV